MAKNETSKTVTAEIVDEQAVDAKDFFGGTEETEQATNEVVIKDDSGAVAIFNPNTIRYYSSLVAETIQEKGQILKALGNSDFTLKQVAEKKVIMLQHIIAHGVELTNTETGKKEKADRIVFVMENGQTLSGCSKGFKSSTENLMGCFGKPPYYPALPLVIMDVTTRSGNNTFNIVLADEDCKLPVVGKK